MNTNTKPVVGIVMGSDSDWPVMREAAEALREFDVTFEADSDAGLLAAGWATVSLVAAHVHDGQSATMPALSFDEGEQR